MNPMNLFRKKPRPSAHPEGVHMTWAHSSAARTATRTAIFLKQQTWVFPILAIVVLSVLAFSVRKAIESTMKANLQSQLQTLLNVEKEMLQTWIGVQCANAESEANDFQVRETIYELLAEIEQSEQAPQGLIPATRLNIGVETHRKLRNELGPGMASHNYLGYFVADKNKRIVSATHEETIGLQNLPEYDTFLTRALEGKTSVCPPFPSNTMQKDAAGNLRTGVPTMFVCAPVRDARFQVVAALAFRMRPESEFTRLMQLGQIGKTGETYAFDKSGRMVSGSRFDESLILLGLLPDTPLSSSILNLSVKDPGGNLATGYRPALRRGDLPLTKMAASAVLGNSGVDVNGYRDYRGVPVIGAWTWMEAHQMGVATEIDSAEAFRPLSILQWTFWGLYALLAISSAAIFVFTLMVARLRRQAQKSAIESQKLGQYTLEKKLGTGGMGVVYKGIHAVLRRPTAIKLLNVDKVNDDSIKRFEREVQITCQLNHPNTVAIYDYGRTPEGVFYYAMEYLDGIDLQTLVDRYGAQPEDRVIHILRQICGSLYEAHSLGLVHRDIKPANIMFNRRGSEPDVVKVLDFGLVKALDDEKNAGMTSTNGLTGTPLYMSPESIQTPQSVDARSDIYAVGAVGYFLLTGQPVFSGSSIVELCQAHVARQPDPPSVKLGKPVSPELEGAIMACLEKSRARRPQTTRDLILLMSRCPSANTWSIEDADAWWGRHERSHASTTGTAASDANKSAASAGFDQTMITG
ncbi:MAG: serine/threonine protein kinase [Planctomycetes bacterium]|nr:serine/threonine protein kinase [Planctomycetota bacterium]